MAQDKPDTTDAPIMQKLMHEQPVPDMGLAPRQPINVSDLRPSEEDINKHHDTQFEEAVKKAAQELQTPVESKSKFWNDHPFAGALLQGLIQSVSMAAPGRGPGPVGFGSGASIARPYYGINPTGEGFPVNPQGRTYTFPSLPVRTNADNFMMSIMNKFGRMLGHSSETENVASSSAASLRGQEGIKGVAQEEEAGKLQREQDYFGRLLSPREEKAFKEKGDYPRVPVSEEMKKIIQEYRDRLGMEGKGFRKGPFDKK